jgi:hypothetical protein
MIKFIGAALVLAGFFLGTYATLSGDHTDARAPRPASLTMAVVKPLLSAAETDPPKAMPMGELTPRIPVALHVPSSPAPLDTLTITREIQLQLKRVGCYQGAINGVWSPAVMRSMKEFADHANAILPVERPDIILLALVQNHRGGACGASCPGEQARAADGRCLPHALMARTAKKKPIDADLISASVPTPSAAHGPSAERPLAGKRMSLGASALPVEKPKALSKRYAQARTREASPHAVNPYSRHPRWAARAFAPF